MSNMMRKTLFKSNICIMYSSRSSFSINNYLIEFGGTMWYMFHDPAYARFFEKFKCIRAGDSEICRSIDF